MLIPLRKRVAPRKRRLYTPQARKTREIMLSVALLAALISLGVVGYELIEGWGLLDALYMTVTTLTTVGFMEVHPLSPAGRVFTILLVIIGVGAVLGVLSTLATIVIERHLTWYFERRTMQKIIDELEDHTIFCGYGRLSQIAVQRLLQANLPLLVIETDETKLELAQNAGCLVLKGDATRDEVLQQAGIARAKTVISLLPKDSDNLYVILTARELNGALFIISRAEDEFGEKRIKRAGADQVIYPYRVGGCRIADGLLRPNVTRFLDIAAGGHGGDLLIEEIVIPVDSPVAGRTLRESAIRKKTNVMIAAVTRPSGEMVFNPPGETVLDAGATLIGLGHQRDFRELEGMLLGQAATQ